MANSLTTFLAIWGAILGTIGTIVSVSLAIREFRKDHHKLKIQADFCGSPFQDGKQYVVVSVLNTGFRPIQIRSVDVHGYLGEKKMKDRALPMTLSEGTHLEVFFEIPAIRSGIHTYGWKEAIAVVEDGENRRYEYAFHKHMTEIILKK